MNAGTGRFAAPWLVAALAAAGPARAAGGTALDAFNFVTGARAAGMGGAAAATAVDATALQWNPSGLARIPSFSASLSHLAWVADIAYSYAGATVPVPAGFLRLPLDIGAGASVQALDYGTIESTRGLAAPASASDLGFTLGAGVRVAEAWSGGVAAKYFRHALDDEGVSEAAFDVGATYEAMPGTLVLAVVLQNAAGYVGELERDRPPLPSTFRAGVAYRTRLAGDPIPAGTRRPALSPLVHAIASADVLAYQRGEPVHSSIGAEVDVNGLLFLRIGNLRAVKEAGPGAGFSAGLGVSAYGVRLDYAYGSLGDLGRGQYMTLSWAPAGPAPSSPPPRGPGPDARYREAIAAYGAQRFAQAEAAARAVVEAAPRHWRAWQLLGSCRHALGDVPGAVEASRRSLGINPDNAPLRAWVEQLEGGR